ncbi:MAG: hypothetical protein ACXWMC_07220 [Syntrophales bacterium]
MLDPLRVLSPGIIDIGGFGHTSMGSCRKPDVFICPIPKTGIDAKVKFQIMRLAPFSELFFERRNQRAEHGING